MARESPPRLTGTIRRLQREKGFGFLQADGQDYFFHRSALAAGQAFDTLSEGMTVTFVAVASLKGPRAEQISVG